MADSIQHSFPEDWKMTLKNGLEMLVEHARLPSVDRNILKGMFEGLEGIGGLVSSLNDVPLEYVLLWQIVKKEAEHGEIPALIEDAQILAELIPQIPAFFDPQLFLQGTVKQSPFIRILSRLQKSLRDSKNWKETEGIMEMLNTYLMTYFQKLIPPNDQLEFWDRWLDVYAAFKECDLKNFSPMQMAIKQLIQKVQKITWNSSL